VAPLDTPGAVGVLAGAIILGLLLALLLWRVAGGIGAIGGLLLGVLLGGLLGFATTVDAWTWGPAVGLAITIGLIAWPIVNVALTWPRLDMAAHFARLQPTQSREAFAETKTWLEEQWRNRSPMPGGK
jgi:FtsH-binding integral membrane protein